ncbi:MAG: cupredoxin domain-containing protein [Candidatus Liptonbacteria bacterium]|nr:cupredoxin domain-containing protein [Candidatus Liptonbacteria bacterium]
MNKTILAVVIVAVVLVGGYFLLRGAYQPTQPVPQTSNQQTAQQPINQPSATVQPSQQPPASQAPVVTPTTYNVSIQGFAFNQKSINVKKGDTVVWTNKDSAPHTVTGNNGGPASGTLNSGGTYSFTFNGTGTFDYHCAIHPYMTGSVVVTQ